MPIHRLWTALALFLALTISTSGGVAARHLDLRSMDAASAVIDAVNSMRASHGLPAYSVSSILMGTAQGQADYMASTGSITHTGPGGTRPYQRVLAAGYPLDGQIPPGFCSENIVGSPGMSPSDAVSSWTSDEPHLNTMLSPYLQEIGAGVANSGGLTYYVIDAARPKGSGEIAAYTPGASESQFSSANEIIVPVSLSTPDANGDLYHEVQAGQSLWQIATSYGVHIVDIQKLNNLGNTTVIQQGQKLLIKRLGTPTPQPTATLAPDTPTPTELPTAVVSTLADAVSPTVAPPAASGPSGATVTIAAIAVVALVAAGLVAWAGRSKPI